MSEATLHQPAMILVAPQMGENIGAAARAMWNFGLTDMRLVAPRDGWPNERAVAMASGASTVLERARVFDTTAEAVADLHYLFATTARGRERIKPVFAPQPAAEDGTARMAGGQGVGILFGRERTGLENEDVTRANAILSVPVNPAFSSLNLAQCVLLVAYEWRRANVEAPAVSPESDRAEPAPRGDIERLGDLIVAELDDSGFFFPEHKRETGVSNLRNILSRAPMTEPEARLMFGVIKALAHKRRRGRV